MIDAGARILESACGPCIGMGQSPNSKGISLRTFNRNFEGRSGTKDGQIYLVSPEVAAASAVAGVFTDPRELGEMPEFKLPEVFKINDNMVVPPVPVSEMDSVEILRGPNIKPFPETSPLDDSISAPVSLKVGDNIRPYNAGGSKDIAAEVKYSGYLPALLYNMRRKIPGKSKGNG